MPFIENDDVIQALTPDRADHPLYMTVLPRRPRRGWSRRDPQGLVYQGSFAKSAGAVSLFDFEGTSEEDALGTFQKWTAHLYEPDARLTVWIGLCRDRLPGHLILADEVGKLAPGTGNWYPRDEACHVGPIPADAFAAVLAVSTAGPQQYEALANNEAALPRLRELTEQWPDPEIPLVRRLRAGRNRNARSE